MRRSKTPPGVACSTETRCINHRCPVTAASAVTSSPRGASLGLRRTRRDTASTTSRKIASTASDSSLWRERGPAGNGTILAVHVLLNGVVTTAASKWAGDHAALVDRRSV